MESTQACWYMCLCLFRVYACVRTCVCVYICMCACVSVSVFVYVYVGVCWCVCALESVGLFVCFRIDVEVASIDKVACIVK